MKDSLVVPFGMIKDFLRLTGSDFFVGPYLFDRFIKKRTTHYLHINPNPKISLSILNPYFYYYYFSSNFIHNLNYASSNFKGNHFSSFTTARTLNSNLDPNYTSVSGVASLDVGFDPSSSCNDLFGVFYCSYGYSDCIGFFFRSGAIAESRYLVVAGKLIAFT
jgi:hypothetical protein